MTPQEGLPRSYKVRCQIRQDFSQDTGGHIIIERLSFNRKGQPLAKGIVSEIRLTMTTVCYGRYHTNGYRNEEAHH